MQDLIREYGGALITVVAILALIAVISVLIGSDEGSVVGQAFSGLISHFFESAPGAGASVTPSALP